MYSIILGRDETDRKKFGDKATILLGKHYVTMEQTKSLANPVLLDVNRPHILLVSGKRGSGKSYTMGVIAEGLMNLPKNLSQNLSCVIFDTMGIYWTMKYPNYKDERLLSKWNLTPTSLKPKIYVPLNLFDGLQEEGIPVDQKFSIKPADIDVEDWCALFRIDLNSNEGVLLERVILSAKRKYRSFTIDKIIKAIQSDDRSTEEERDLLIARFESVDKWGLFSDLGVDVKSLTLANQISVIDLSAYSQVVDGNIIKNLVIGFICKKVLQQRLLARKKEEIAEIEGNLLKKTSRKEPLVWILIDEAHEFLPKTGDTLAAGPLIQLLREGRQPGISMVLATQQPGKIHTDVMTQADIVLSHRLTAKLDVNALNDIMQSYLPFELEKYIDGLPRVKGAAIALDDNSEKIFPLRIRPRFSWHGGGDPSVIKAEIKRNVIEDLE